MLELVQRPRDRGRRTELRLDDDEISRGGHPAAELTEDRQKQLAGRRATGRVREDVPRPAERVAGLLEPELADVAGHRRLRYHAACVPQRVEQLELCPHAFARHDADDQTVAVRLAEYAF